MKIFITPALALFCVLSSTSNVSARDFTSPSKNIKTAAIFDSKGVNMEVCPSGDCKAGKYMKLTVTGLTELDSKGVKVTSVTQFKPKDSDWTAIVNQVVNNVSVASTKFVSTMEVGTAKTEVGFNLTAEIFQANATVVYGSQNLFVPAGALKFTVEMGAWPFANIANTLALDVKLDAKGAKGADIGKPAKKAKTDKSLVDRVTLGDSMFMDAPSIVFLDGVEKNVINSSVVTVGADTSFEWVFPSFTKTLFYDPVLGDDSVTNTTTSGASTPTSAPASSASSLSTSGIAAAVFALLAYIVI